MPRDLPAYLQALYRTPLLSPPRERALFLAFNYHKYRFVAARRKLEPGQASRKTLRPHYDRKRRHYGLLHPHFYDRDLRRLFSDSPEYTRHMKPARFIARVRRDVRRMVAEWTGEYQYTLDIVLGNIIGTKLGS